VRLALKYRHPKWRGLGGCNPAKTPNALEQPPERSSFSFANVFKTKQVATFGSVMHSSSCRVHVRNLWRYRASDRWYQQVKNTLTLRVPRVWPDDNDMYTSSSAVLRTFAGVSS